MSGRVYVRKFDWDEARQLREQGMTLEALANRFGVTDTAILLAVDDEFRARSTARRKKWGKEARCIDCGEQVTRTRRDDQRRCVSCASLAAATSVRPDALRCVSCREWKPDEAFPLNRAETIARRGRHGVCRACQTTMKRAYRRRNRERQNAYDRAYKARRRAQARAEDRASLKEAGDH